MSSAYTIRKSKKFTKKGIENFPCLLIREWIFLSRYIYNEFPSETTYQVTAVFCVRTETTVVVRSAKLSNVEIDIFTVHLSDEHMRIPDAVSLDMHVM